MGRPFTIHDDRGKPHSMPDPAGAGRRRRHRTAHDETDAPNPALRVHRMLRLKLEVARSPIRRWTFSLLCIALGVAMLSIVAPNDSAHSASVLGVVSILFGGRLLVISPKRPARISRKIALLPPMCAVCGCDMQDVYPDRQGIADCPRCAAAWTLACAKHTSASPTS